MSVINEMCNLCRKKSDFVGHVIIIYSAGDRELIQEVLFDAVVTAPLEAYWTGLALNKSE